MITELALHIAAVHFLRNNIAPDWIFWHCLNGEKQDPRTIAKLKAMGVTKGIPDLCLLGPDSQIRFLEFKREDGH